MNPLDVHAEACSCFFRVSSGSMVPVLCPGDLLYALPIVSDRVRVGEVILFRCRNGVMVHRVLGRVSFGGGVWLFHAGDSTPVPGVVDRTQVIGRAVRFGESEPIPGRLPCTSKNLSVRLLCATARFWLAGLWFVSPCNRVSWGWDLSVTTFRYLRRYAVVFSKGGESRRCEVI